jgi:hypothetical protein
VRLLDRHNLIAALGAASVLGCRSGPSIQTPPSAVLLERGEAGQRPSQARRGHQDEAGAECSEISRAVAATSGTVLDSLWFQKFDSLRELNDAIRAVDAPDVETPIPGDAPQGAYRAVEARWQYLTVAGRIVSSRQVMRPPSSYYELRMEVAGKFVVGSLAGEDYSCPGSSAENCYPGCQSPPTERCVKSPQEKECDVGDEAEYVEGMCCENNLYVRCLQNGMDLTIELLDVETSHLVRLEHLRHAKDLRVSVDGKGNPRLEVGGCLLHWTDAEARTRADPTQNELPK